MKYINITYDEKLNELLPALDKGVFMTTKVGDKVNTMTIAWGGINIIWNKQVFITYVRYSRDTYDMLQNTDEFTISVPRNNNLRKELGICGTKSGRDINKIEQCNFNLVDGRVVSTPIIKECEMHYECKVIYKQAMEPNSIPKDVLERNYKNNDFHAIFYGEIVDSYIIKGD